MEIIVARDVVKTYRVGVGRARIREMTPAPFDAALKRAFPRWWLRNTFNALDGISLSVPKGTALGLVGHNGAGKTTLLSLMAGVSAPTTGSIVVAGRIAAILDVTVGFHPDLTGRENLFLAAGMHGLSRRDVLARQERILDFAELGGAIDTPLKRYSAGMTARLGFATVAALDADVLLIDEVLAVGDAAFQRKCIEWLDSFRRAGGTLLFVSHNLSLIRHMTERVVWLDHGHVLADGSTNRTLAEYGKASARRREEPDAQDLRGARKQMRTRGHDRWGVGGVRVAEADVTQAEPERRSLVARISYEARSDCSASFSVGFIDESGYEVGASLSPPFRVTSQTGSVRWDIPQLPLRPGIYFPVVSVLSAEGAILDRWKLDRPVVFEMNGHADIGADLGPTEFGGSWSDV
jgi:ABC-type polysaccharide/polyol phosphate transport system ATPase subunit